MRVAAADRLTESEGEISFGVHGGHRARLASLGTDMLRELPGQRGNRSIAYYLWDGSRCGMSGLWQRADWTDAATQVHSHKIPPACSPAGAPCGR